MEKFYFFPAGTVDEEWSGNTGKNFFLLPPFLLLLKIFYRDEFVVTADLGSGTQMVEILIRGADEETAVSGKDRPVCQFFDHSSQFTALPDEEIVFGFLIISGKGQRPYFVGTAGLADIVGELGMTLLNIHFPADTAEFDLGIAVEGDPRAVRLDAIHKSTVAAVVDQFYGIFAVHDLGMLSADGPVREVVGGKAASSLADDQIHHAGVASEKDGWPVQEEELYSIVFQDQLVCGVEIAFYQNIFRLPGRLC